MVLRQPPPHSCVVTFVASALQEYVQTCDLARLAHLLGMRVGPEDANPWNVPIEPDPSLRGITLDRFERAVPSVLLTYAPELRFRYVPFNTIAFGLYDAVLEAALAASCTIGVSYNYAHLQRNAGTVRHVSRVCRAEFPHHVILSDTTGTDPNDTSRIHWENLCAAVNDISGGYLIIGHARSMSLDYTLPWSDPLSNTR